LFFNCFLNRIINYCTWFFALLKEVATMFKTMRSFARDESGATAIEYGLIAALVSVAAIAALRGMGNSLQNLFGVVSGELTAAVLSAQNAG
jgi:pilus assembly protein Flp/PilA